MILSLIEITSPGGMYSGKVIQEQDIDRLQSERRNPIIADLFHRMKFMERRGSGLKKIVAETKMLPGYSARFLPDFYSTASSFTVVLKNVNYFGEEGVARDSDVGINDGKSVGINDGINVTQHSILNLLTEKPTISMRSMADILGLQIRSVERQVAKMKEAGLIEREGAKKKEQWIVKS